MLDEHAWDKVADKPGPADIFVGSVSPENPMAKKACAFVHGRVYSIGTTVVRPTKIDVRGDTTAWRRPVRTRRVLVAYSVGRGQNTGNKHTEHA